MTKMARVEFDVTKFLKYSRKELREERVRTNGYGALVADRSRKGPVMRNCCGLLLPVYLA